MRPILALLLLVASQSLAQNAPTTDCFRRFDKNADGKLTAQELNMPKLFGLTVCKAGTKKVLGYEEVRTDFCYRSKKSPTHHVGLGPETAMDVLVKLPSGREPRFKHLKANQTHKLNIERP